MRRYILTYITSIFIVVASTMKISQFPSIPMPGIDKPIHFSMYALLTFVIALDYSHCLKRRLNCLNCIAIPLISTLFGFAMECIQYFLPYRSFSLWDMLANTLGAILGIIIFIIIQLLRRGH